MSTGSKLSSFEAVVAGFTSVAIFTLGYSHWRLAIRQDEQEARIERQREEFERSLLQLQREGDDKRAADSFELELVSLASPHLSRLRDSGRDAATSQRIVAAAAELLASRGRPALLQLTEKIREQSVPPQRTDAQDPQAATDGAGVPAPRNAWLVLLATFPGNDRKKAEDVANDKLRVAKDLGMIPVVSVYKTRLKGRYVVALGEPVDRSRALSLAARARRGNLSLDAFAEPGDGWELTGTAPFPPAVRSASLQ